MLSVLETDNPKTSYEIIENTKISIGVADISLILQAKIRNILLPVLQGAMPLKILVILLRFSGCSQ